MRTTSLLPVTPSKPSLFGEFLLIGACFLLKKRGACSFGSVCKPSGDAAAAIVLHASS